jgi:quinoprotein glucose dehydrogenase
MNLFLSLSNLGPVNLGRARLGRAHLVRTRRRSTSLSRTALLAGLVAVLNPAGRSQDWPHYGGDAGGSKYSALDQINKMNVKNLKVAWTFDSGELSAGKEYPTRSAFEATPIVIDGVLYVTSPFAHLFALDSDTGKQLWDFDPKIDRTLRLNLFINRGVTYWQEGERKRIFLGDQNGRLYSIDAATGKLDAAFGTGGVLDLAKDMLADFPDGKYGLTSPVSVCGGVVVVGGFVSDGRPRGPSGDIRGFDAATGKPSWRFHTVPHPGEFGHETWEGDSWKGRGGTNAWSALSVDEKNGLVFVPITSASNDFYGGDRKGANLFSDSVVALNCKTGERKWHFQAIHHDLWDYDFPAQPLLATVRRDGKDVAAVAQVSKQGFVYVLDRLSGEPLFEIEERPVPKVETPGEHAWPTQPIPVKPPPYARQSMRADEITDVTPESRAECLELTKGAVFPSELFSPITEQPTVLFPGLNGGANWGGAAFDPADDVLFINSMDVGGLFRMVKRPEDSEIAYSLRGVKYEFFWDSNRYPCQKPPWGSLTAIDLNSGAFRWRVTLGEFDELTAKGVPPTGAPNLGGPIVTAGGLVFIAATSDSKFRAFDKDTGVELWVTKLPASGMATPATYLGKRTGKQFVVIAAGGGNKYDSTFGSKLVAFALP